MSGDDDGATLAFAGLSMLCFSLVGCVLAGIVLVKLQGTAAAGTGTGVGAGSNKRLSKKYFPPYSSVRFGGSGGDQFTADCNRGDYVGYAIIAHGNENVDGLLPYCLQVGTKNNYPLFSSAPNEQKYIGRFDAPKTFWDKFKRWFAAIIMTIASMGSLGAPSFAEAAIASSAINMSPDKGGRLYPATDFMSPYGFSGAKVWTDGTEIRGLQFMAPDGRSSTPVGNTEGGLAPVTFTCPNQQIITGIDARAGSRIDSLKFKCTSV